MCFFPTHLGGRQRDFLSVSLSFSVSISLYLCLRVCMCVCVVHIHLCLMARRELWVPCLASILSPETYFQLQFFPFKELSQCAKFRSLLEFKICLIGTAEDQRASIAFLLFLEDVEWKYVRGQGISL